jgi:hypothetical protein
MVKISEFPAVNCEDKKRTTIHLRINIEKLSWILPDLHTSEPVCVSVFHFFFPKIVDCCEVISLPIGMNL